jgi:hypothetical protein
MANQASVTSFQALSITRGSSLDTQSYLTLTPAHVRGPEGLRAGDNGRSGGGDPVSGIE